MRSESDGALSARAAKAQGAQATTRAQDRQRQSALLALREAQRSEARARLAYPLPDPLSLAHHTAAGKNPETLSTAVRNPEISSPARASSVRENLSTAVTHDAPESTNMARKSAGGRTDSGRNGGGTDQTGAQAQAGKEGRVVVGDPGLLSPSEKILRAAEVYMCVCVCVCTRLAQNVCF